MSLVGGAGPKMKPAPWSGAGASWANCVNGANPPFGSEFVRDADERGGPAPQTVVVELNEHIAGEHQVANHGDLETSAQAVDGVARVFRGGGIERHGRG